MQTRNMKCIKILPTCMGPGSNKYSPTCWVKISSVLKDMVVVHMHTKFVVLLEVALNRSWLRIKTMLKTTQQEFSETKIQTQ